MRDEIREAPSIPAGPSAGDANPVERLFDFILDERRIALFPPRARVLDVGRDGTGGPGGAAFAGPDTVARLGPEEVGRRVREWLPAGAPFLLAVSGARPLPAIFERALTAAGDWRPRSAAARSHGGGLRDAFGPGLEWRGGFALGVLLPGRARAAWAAAHPLAFGLLAVGEELVRRWPIVRALGEITVLEGVRR